MSVLVTGGTGKTGRRLADLLRARGVTANVASRHSAGGRRFDWHDRATWDVALDGADAVYLVTPPGDAAGLMIDFCGHALSRGCQRFVLLSASLLPAGGPGAGQVHAWLSNNTPAWGVLRPSWFMQNFTEGPHAETIRDEGAIHTASEDGRVGFISADDIAAVAAAMLTSKVAPNRDAILTGPQAISYDDAAAVLSRRLGKHIRHIRISVDDLAARHRSRGMVSMGAQILAGMDAFIAQGAEDRTTNEVAKFSGRPGVGFEAYCEAAFRSR